MKTLSVSFLLFFLASFGRVYAQQEHPSNVTDTIWAENNQILSGNIMQIGSIEDSIQLAIKNNDSAVLVVINENIIFNHILSFDSILLSLLRYNNFIRTDYKYPCNALFTNECFDSIIVHMNCTTGSLTRVSIASLSNCYKDLVEISRMTDFFINKAKNISKNENCQYYMFICGVFNKKKSEITSVIPSPSWIVVLDNKGNVVKFQYSDSYILGKKEYNVNSEEMY